VSRWHEYAAFDISNVRWVLTESSTNAPNYTDSDECPGWTKVYSNAE
jgi:hypothetical protein